MRDGGDAAPARAKSRKEHTQPPPSYSQARKRPAESLDQLPHPRKLTFGRKFYQGSEDQLQRLLGAHPGTEAVRVVLGRAVCPSTGREIILPFSSECILDAKGHKFEPALTDDTRERLLQFIREQSAGGSGPRRWAEVSVGEGMARGPAEPRESLTFYCPQSQWHFQVQAGDTEPALEPGPAPRERHEVTCVFRKDASPGGIWWSLTLARQADASDTAELRVSTKLLWEQHRRMLDGKAHSFSLLCRDLLRNARVLAALLRDGDQEVQAPAACFFPGLEDAKAREVAGFYAERARQGTAASSSDSEKVRRYNNLVKMVLLERFLDPLPAPVRVLDLGCGRGQDIMKYSRAHRGSKLEKYVGIDFALEAVQEAKRRHAKLAGSSRRRDGEYAASFYVGDLRRSEVFEQLAAGGHTCFDVVAMQFMLHYQVETEQAVQAFLERVSGLLRPGGRLIGCIPSSDSLAELFASATPDASGTRRKGNKLYSVCFPGDRWAEAGRNEALLENAFAQQFGMPYTFSLVDAVDAQEEFVVPWEAFEELAQSVGLQVTLDAPFPELLRAYGDSFDRLSAAKLGPLTAEEQELFGLYSAFVLEKVISSP